jgi:hypothetical protein
MTPTYTAAHQGDGTMGTRQNDIPRRNKMYEWILAELAIFDAVGLVEAIGADVLLTDAVDLLHQARAKVADYVDRQIARTNP